MVRILSVDKEPRLFCYIGPRPWDNLSGSDFINIDKILRTAYESLHFSLITYTVYFLRKCCIPLCTIKILNYLLGLVLGSHPSGSGRTLKVGSGLGISFLDPHSGNDIHWTFHGSSFKLIKRTKVLLYTSVSDPDIVISLPGYSGKIKVHFHAPTD